jgi:hypothetical protein
MPIIAAALVAVGVAFAHAIKHPHHPTTTAAPRKAGQQRAPAAR